MAPNYLVFIAIFFLILGHTPVLALRIKKVGGVGSVGKHVQKKSPMMAHMYLSARRGMVYLWGKERFENI